MTAESGPLPVPASVLFLRMRGWIGTDLTPPGLPLRPSADVGLLHQCGERLGLW